MTLLAQMFPERRGEHNGDTLTRDVIIVVLPFLLSVHVFLEADLFISRLGRIEPQYFSNLKIVNGVLTDPKLRAFDKLFVELLVVIV